MREERILEAFGLRLRKESVMGPSLDSFRKTKSGGIGTSNLSQIATEHQVEVYLLSNMMEATTNSTASIAQPVVTACVTCRPEKGSSVIARAVPTCLCGVGTDFMHDRVVPRCARQENVLFHWLRMSLTSRLPSIQGNLTFMISDLLIRIN